MIKTSFVCKDRREGAIPGAERLHAAQANGHDGGQLHGAKLLNLCSDVLRALRLRVGYRTWHAKLKGSEEDPLNISKRTDGNRMCVVSAAVELGVLLWSVVRWRGVLVTRRACALCFRGW